MTRVKVVMKPGARRKIRYLPSLARELERHGNRIVTAANATLPEHEGYRMSSQPGVPRPFGRHRVSVAAVSRHAKRSNAKHNTLLRVL